MSEEWVGPDQDLETSLFEYGVVAKQLDTKDYDDEWFVLYCIAPNAFGTGHIRESELDGLIDGKDWMDETNVRSFLSFVGMSKKEWKKSSFMGKLSDLISYCGTANILGEDYYPMTEKEALGKIKS